MHTRQLLSYDGKNSIFIFGNRTIINRCECVRTTEEKSPCFGQVEIYAKAFVITWCVRWVSMRTHRSSLAHSEIRRFLQRIINTNFEHYSEQCEYDFTDKLRQAHAHTPYSLHQLHIIFDRFTFQLIFCSTNKQTNKSSGLHSAAIWISFDQLFHSIYFSNNAVCLAVTAEEANASRALTHTYTQISAVQTTLAAIVFLLDRSVLALFRANDPISMGAVICVDTTFFCCCCL